MIDVQWWVVLVGAAHEEDTEEYDVHGPFTIKEADLFAQEVKDVWEQHADDEFTYGTPWVDVRAVLPDPGHPFYSRAAKAAANWYTDKELQS
jgi:hypothetical protein